MKFGLYTAWEGQVIAPSTYSYMVPQNLHSDVTKVFHSESYHQTLEHHHENPIITYLSLRIGKKEISAS